MKWTQQLREAHKLAIFGSASFGAAILIFGSAVLAFSKWDLAGSIAIALGGALLGASLSAAIARSDLDALLNRVSEELDTFRHDAFGLLTESLGSTFTSDEKHICAFKRKWHVYHLTQIADEWKWRYHVMDFSEIPAAASLTAFMTSRAMSGEKVTYKIEAGVRHDRLVAFLKPRDHKEPHGIFTFPIADTTASSFAGLAIIRTWAQTHGVFPVIAIRDPIQEEKTSGTTVEDAETVKTLEREWKSRFRAVNDAFLPMFSGPVSTTKDLFGELEAAIEKGRMAEETAKQLVADAVDEVLRRGKTDNKEK